MVVTVRLFVNNQIICLLNITKLGIYMLLCWTCCDLFIPIVSLIPLTG